MTEIISSYQSRITKCADKKKSPIILALDYDLDNDNNRYLLDKCKEIVTITESQICAIKINFHLFLSLSYIQLLNLNMLAHKFDLQSIADIKLNDIGNTNKVTVKKLQKLGFDAVIVNPFIGVTEMKSIVNYAHSIKFGIISLVYMSHPTSFEGYGLQISSSNNTNRENLDSIPMYRLLYSYARSSGGDGIVIGATKIDIIKEISKLNEIQIYSPGFLTQGGSILDAIKAGTDYFIVGRYILDSSSPINDLKQMLYQIEKAKKI
ncbi:MAG TPA: orotidine 5'-phosphate decarboxylase [Nitrososphaeraceae archaeon]|nr:orotidine 5'-phosphate decarboxylase [Nitrososphaeraceae archaeon]